MEHRTHSFDEETLTSERAFEWLRRLEGADAREVDAFRAWINRSPQNGGEVLVATSSEVVLRQLFRGKRIDVNQFLSASANVLTIGEHASAQKPSAVRRLRFFSIAGLGVAAAMAALFLGPLVRDWFSPNEFTTSVGEQRAIQLPDGSAIAINTQSSVRVAFSANARDVYLDRGQAMFTVAKDASRPFRVHVAASSNDGVAGGKAAIIQALGTKFDVRLRTARVNVAVVEGIVQVRADDPALPEPGQAPAALGKPARVTAGHAVSIESTGLITAATPINVGDVSAWQQRRLVFADNTLEEIAEEFRRYNQAPKIRIADDALRSRRFSGVFDADNPQGLLTYLALDDSIILDREGNDVVIRSRAAVEQPRQPRTD